MLTTQLLHSGLLHSGELLFEMTPAGVYLEHVGPPELLSVPPDTFVGRAVHELLPTDVANTVMRCISAVATDGKAQTLEFSLNTLEGELRYFEALVAKLADGNLLIVMHDVQARKVAELKVQESESRLRIMADKARQQADSLALSLRERTGLLAKLERRSRDLARSNGELEQFVYAASHDLRAPLRAIQMLSEWIETDLSGLNRPEVSDQLTLLRKRVARMSGLLDDLLEYSRVGRETHSIRTVDTRQLLLEIIEMLAAPAGFTIVLPASLPVLETPLGPLKQVFMNLLSNAVIHHDLPTGRVTVDVRDIGNFFEFTVSDDGPGIARRFQEKVFQVFQTLQPRDRVEGSGVGLALVKKSVESAGGKVELNSEGRGCHFCFTWPKRWGQAEDDSYRPSQAWTELVHE